VVKLIDFGLSRTRALDAKLSRSEVGGTPQYMAPEQIRGQAPAPSMDIYALGAMLFEMLTRRLPFLGDVNEVLRGHLFSEPPRPSDLAPEPLDEALEAVVLRALSKDPAARQPTMVHLLSELRTVGDMLGRRHSGKRGRGAGRRPRPPVSTHTHCQACPFPIFRVDEAHRLAMANPAFGRFVKDSLESLSGRPIHETRLPTLYRSLRDDLDEVLDRGEMIQRVLRYQPAGQDPVAVMASLVPERTADGLSRSVYGLVVPLYSERFACVEPG
jgi:serine/threonine protein kinase